MISELKSIYAATWAVIAGAPLILIIPVLGEGLQHAVEYQLGMFVNAHAFTAFAHSVDRLTFGIVKAASIILAVVLTLRFRLHSQTTDPDARRELRRHEFAKAVRLWCPGDATWMLVLVIAVVPLMFIHARLNHAALGQSASLTIGLLVGDSLLVGLLAIVLGNTTFERGGTKSQIAEAKLTS